MLRGCDVTRVPCLSSSSLGGTDPTSLPYCPSVRGPESGTATGGTGLAWHSMAMPLCASVLPPLLPLLLLLLNATAKRQCRLLIVPHRAHHFPSWEQARDADTLSDATPYSSHYPYRNCCLRDGFACTSRCPAMQRVLTNVPDPGHAPYMPCHGLHSCSRPRSTCASLACLAADLGGRS